DRWFLALVPRLADLLSVFSRAARLPGRRALLGGLRRPAHPCCRDDRLCDLLARLSAAGAARDALARPRRPLPRLHGRLQLVPGAADPVVRHYRRRYRRRAV